VSDYFAMLKLFAFPLKHIERIGRSPSILLVSGAIAIFSAPSSAWSQSKPLVANNPSDFVCYMQTLNGRVINLNKLCSIDKEQAIALSTTDQRFFDRYQSLLKKRSTALPSVQTALWQAQQNPQAVLQRAQDVCTALRTGQPQSSNQGQVGDDLFATIAPRYYCPDLDD
jgi:hypothetical protein